VNEHDTSTVVSGDRARRALAEGLLCARALTPDSLTRATALLAWRLFVVRVLADRGIEPAVALDADLHDADGATGTNLRIRDAMERCRQAVPGVFDQALPSGYAEHGTLPLREGTLRAAAAALRKPAAELAPGRFYESLLGCGFRREGAAPRVVRCRGTARSRGAFYTPAPVVEAILDDTLRKQVADSAPVRVLDPCCGAGAFLIPALTRLLARGKTGATRDCGVVTVLRDSIFGVDIDPLAVEACRLGLALQALGAQEDSDHGVSEMWDEMSCVLPHNIRCGDALDGEGRVSSVEGQGTVCVTGGPAALRCVPGNLSPVRSPAFGRFWCIGASFTPR